MVEENMLWIFLGRLIACTTGGILGGIPATTVASLLFSARGVGIKYQSLSLLGVSHVDLSS